MLAEEQNQSVLALEPFGHGKGREPVHEVSSKFVHFTCLSFLFNKVNFLFIMDEEKLILEVKKYEELYNTGGGVTKIFFSFFF
jgi:hypothetical protein